jgi:hypothetical protein
MKGYNTFPPDEVNILLWTQDYPPDKFLRSVDSTHSHHEYNSTHLPPGPSSNGSHGESPWSEETDLGLLRTHWIICRNVYIVYGYLSHSDGCISRMVTSVETKQRMRGTKEENRITERIQIRFTVNIYSGSVKKILKGR